MFILQYIVESLETEEQIKTAEEIFEKYQNAMFQIAYHILENVHDAEESVGDTIIKICRHIDDFTVKTDEERKLLIKKYTERTAIDKLRENNRKFTETLGDYLFDTMEGEKDIYGYEDDITFTGDEFGELQKYVKKLPQKYKDVLILKYVNDMKNRDIANLLNIPENTVATHISRAKKLLEKMLTEGRCK